MNIINPATEEVITDVPEDDDSSIAGKYEDAVTAQSEWAGRSLDERVEVLARFGELLGRKRDELARTLSLETGKPIIEAENEIAGARARVAFFVANAAPALAPELVGGDSVTEEELSFDPLGVIAHISAWNYPYLVAMNAVVPALLAGNAVLYKPSEYATLSGLEIARSLKDSGVPPGVFTALTGAGAVGRALCELKLDGYFFTGSFDTGNAIARTLAERLVPRVFELGGKDPLYVADDADVAASAAAAAEGSFYNAGQSCCAVERIYVHAVVHDEFVARLKVLAEGLRPGDPLARTTTLGPLTRPSQIAILEGQVRDAVAKGARIITGGGRLTRPGYFFAPTVLANADHRMDVMRRESFGPVIGVQVVADDAEAIRLMNDTEYGLTAAVFSRDRERARGILSRVNTGTSYWNCCDRVSPRLPWSGRGHSGVGMTLSKLGFLAFVRPRAWHWRRLKAPTDQMGRTPQRPCRESGPDLA